MKRIALLACVAACSGEGAKRAASTPEVAVNAKVRKGDIVDRVLVTGVLFASRSEELRVPRTDAWELAIRWMAEDGAQVKAGERALEFDNSSFTAGLEQKKLAYLEANMAFRTYEDVSALDIQQKAFALEAAQIAFAKAKVLASVPADLLAARTAQDRQLELKRTEAAVVRADKELTSAKASNALEKTVKQIELEKAKTDIENSLKAMGELTLVAPRDGIIVIEENPWEDRKFQVGDTAQPGWTILSLPEFSAGMEVRAELSDVDDGRVSVGMTGTCTFDAFPTEPLPCAVKDLMPVATGKGPKSLRRGFSLVASLDKVDGERMRPGMSVKVELRRQPLQGLVVPRGAVRFDRNGKTRVRLAAGERDVQLGPCDAQVCSVTSGLVEGETVRVGGGS